MMNHRKTNHTMGISKCKEYEKGNCRFTDTACWFIHKEDKSETNEGEEMMDVSNYNEDKSETNEGEEMMDVTKDNENKPEDF